MTAQTCDYCDTEELVYELRSDRGPVCRCLRCLAIEQANQSLSMRFERFVDFEADGAVYETDEELRAARKGSFESAQAWLKILGRIQQDDPILKRDPDAYNTVREETRTFLTNFMGADAHKPPSELRGEADG